MTHTQPEPPWKLCWSHQKNVEAQKSIVVGVNGSLHLEKSSKSINWRKQEAECFLWISPLSIIVGQKVIAKFLKIVLALSFHHLYPKWAMYQGYDVMLRKFNLSNDIESP